MSRPRRHKEAHAIRHAVTDPVLLALALLGLAGCGPRHIAASPNAAYEAAPKTGEAAYRRPPSLTRAFLEAGGRMRLEGLADPNSRLRLASPSGQALFTRADGAGAWRLLLPPSGWLRLFGLSMIEGPRSIQAQGYLAIAPGAAAQLRAGAGALVLAPPPTHLAITSLDLDRKGAAVVSGRAAPNATVALWIDSHAAGQVEAGPEGNYAFDLGEPLMPGPHAIQVRQGDLSARAQIDATPGAPPPSGPFDAAPMGTGWRIVWMPPGGGLQTTLLLGDAGNGG